MKLHPRINGRKDIVAHVLPGEYPAAALLDADNRLVAFVRKGWEGATNLCSITWDWVRSFHDK